MKTEFVVNCRLHVLAADRAAAETRVQEMLELLLCEEDVVEVAAYRPEKH